MIFAEFCTTPPYCLKYAQKLLPVPQCSIIIIALI